MGCAEFNASYELKKLAQKRFGIRVKNPHKYLDFAWGYICGFATWLAIAFGLFFIYFVTTLKS